MKMMCKGEKPSFSGPPLGDYGCTFNTAGLRIDAIIVYRSVPSAKLKHDCALVLVWLYLCPERNDPGYYDKAMRWASEQLKKRERIDFTNPLNWGFTPLELGEEPPEPTLLDFVPELRWNIRRQEIRNATTGYFRQ